MSQDQFIITQKPFLNVKTKPLVDSDDTLARIRRLDMNALAYVHEHYFPEVFRYVFFRLSDHHISEDIASEVFMRLLEAIKRGAGPEKNLRAWLLGVASNLVNDHLRQMYRRPSEDLEGVEELPGLDDPAKSFDQAWQSSELKRALSKLTVEQQNVIALRFASECSLEETAVQMKRSVNAVKVLQFRAIAALKRLLEGHRQI